MNTMEIEPIDFLTKYLQQNHEIPKFSQTNSSLSENSSQNSLQDGIFLENEDQSLQISNNIFKGIQAELMEEESLTDLLLAAAEAVESQNQPLVSNLIEKVKTLLLFQMGPSSFNQLAWFFTQGLHCKTFGNYEIEEKDQTAFQMLQQVSPFIKFAHFTANQAILEASQGEEIIHVVDFDIMEGIQWPPLMVDLAAKKKVCILKLTAIVQGKEEQRKIGETGRRLSEFAKSINFPFLFDQMGIEKDENFEQILGQTVIANFCGVFQQRNLVKIGTFLSGVAKLSPKFVVLVEEEIFKVFKSQSISFVEFFFEAFHYFSALSDSLLRCFYESGFKKMVGEFLGTRILESISQFSCDKNGFDHLEGYKKIDFSSFNCSQAKYLVGLFRGDFWVQHEKCSLILCWKSRALCSATIWVPKSQK